MPEGTVRISRRGGEGNVIELEHAKPTCKVSRKKKVSIRRTLSLRGGNCVYYDSKAWALVFTQGS